MTGISAASGLDPAMAALLLDRSCDKGKKPGHVCWQTTHCCLNTDLLRLAQVAYFSKIVLWQHAKNGFP